jgi:hypothetical protein
MSELYPASGGEANYEGNRVLLAAGASNKAILELVLFACLAHEDGLLCSGFRAGSL